MTLQYTHYLLLLTVGGEALGQQGTVLQQHSGDRLGEENNTQILDMYTRDAFKVVVGSHDAPAV